MNTIFSLRLTPGQDLKIEIQNFCEKNKISAGCILSAVGSLSKAQLRLANSKTLFEANENFEIVSATGTVSQNGCHIHISVADASGKVTGGHLLDGNKIYTTCELVILSIIGQEFKREHDTQTGYNELKISLKNS